MTGSSRRVFMLQVIAGTSAVAAGSVGAEEKAKILETDAYPKSMGFKVDTNNVDGAKFPKHTAEQHCKKCQLFSGKEGEEYGPCSFYGGRLVPVNGWCRNFKVKKAAAA
jgi:High potential iron-sulfur protein